MLRDALLLSCLLLTAAHAEDAAMRTPTQLPLLQTITDACVPHHLLLNGFPVDGLRSVRGYDRRVDGFTTTMERYVVVHPYFLSARNQLTASYQLDLSAMVDTDQGPWHLDLRVASVPYPGPRAPYETREYVEQEIADIQSPPLPKVPESATTRTLAGSFAWTQALPAWTWTHGVPITASAPVTASLYAEYVRLHTALAAIRAAHDRLGQAAAFATPLRASMHDYIQACELRGRTFTFLDELSYAGAFLSKGITTPQQAAALAAPAPAAQPAAPQRRPAPPRVTAPVQDGQGPDDTPPGPDGRMPPRLFLADLPPLSAVHLTLMGNGTIARLTADYDAPLITFRSNYKDGPWGAPGTVKLAADVWFRRDAAGAWQVDALWPETSAIEQWGSLDNLLDDLPY